MHDIEIGDVVAYEIIDRLGKWKWTLGIVTDHPHKETYRLTEVENWRRKPRELTPDERKKANIIITQIKAAQDEAEEKRRQAFSTAQEIRAKAAQVAEQQRDADARMAAAKRQLDVAREAVLKIEEAHMREIRSYRTPPDTVRLVLDAVLSAITNHKYQGAKSQWDVVLTKIREKNFQETVAAFDATDLSTEAANTLQKYLKDSRFTHDAAAKASQATLPLYLWVEAQGMTLDANSEMRRIKLRVKDLEAHLKELNELAAQNAEDLRQTLDAIAGLQQKHDDLVSDDLTALRSMVSSGDDNSNASFGLLSTHDLGNNVINTWIANDKPSLKIPILTVSIFEKVTGEITKAFEEDTESEVVDANGKKPVRPVMRLPIPTLMRLQCKFEERLAEMIERRKYDDLLNEIAQLRRQLSDEKDGTGESLAKIDALEKQLDGARGIIAQREKSISDLEKDSASCRSEKESNNRNYEALSQQMDTLRKEVAAMADANNALKEEISSKDMMIEALRTSNKEKDDHNLDAENEAKILSAKIDDLSNLLSQRDQEIALLTEEAAEKAEEMNAMRDRFERSAEIIAGHEAVAKADGDRANQADEKVALLEQKIAELQTLLDAQESVITNLKSDIAANANEVESREACIATLRQDLLACEKRIAEESEKRVSIEQQMSKLQAELETKEADILRLRDDVSARVSDLESSFDRIRALEVELQKSNDDKAEKKNVIKQLEESASESKRKALENEAALKAAADENAVANAEIKSLRDTIEAMQSDANLCEANLESTSEGFIAQIKALQDSLDNAMKTRAALESANVKLSADHTNALAEKDDRIANLLSRCEQLERDLTSAEGARNTLERSKSNLESDVVAKKASMADITRRLKDAEADSDTNRRNADSLQEQLLAALNELKESRAAHAELKERARDTDKQLTISEKRAELDKQELRSTIARLQKELAMAEEGAAERLAQQQRIAADLAEGNEAQLQVLRDRNDALSSEIASIRASTIPKSQADQLRLQLKALEDSAVEYRREIARRTEAMNQLRSEKEEAAARLTTAVAHHEKQQKEARSAISSLSEEKKQLKRQLEEMIVADGIKEQTLSRHAEEKKKLADRNAYLTDDRDSALAKLQRLERRLDEETELFRRRLEELEAALGVAQTELKRLLAPKDEGTADTSSDDEDKALTREGEDSVERTDHLGFDYTASDEVMVPNGTFVPAAADLTSLVTNACGGGFSATAVLDASAAELVVSFKQAIRKRRRNKTLSASSAAGHGANRNTTATSNVKLVRLGEVRITLSDVLQQDIRRLTHELLQVTAMDSSVGVNKESGRDATSIRGAAALRAQQAYLAKMMPRRLVSSIMVDSCNGDRAAVSSFTFAVAIITLTNECYIAQVRATVGGSAGDRVTFSTVSNLSSPSACGSGTVFSSSVYRLGRCEGDLSCTDAVFVSPSRVLLVSPHDGAQLWSIGEHQRGSDPSGGEDGDDSIVAALTSAPRTVVVPTGNKRGQPQSPTQPAQAKATGGGGQQLVALASPHDAVNAVPRTSIDTIHNLVAHSEPLVPILIDCLPSAADEASDAVEEGKGASDDPSAEFLGAHWVSLIPSAATLKQLSGGGGSGSSDMSNIHDVHSDDDDVHALALNRRGIATLLHIRGPRSYHDVVEAANASGGCPPPPITVLSTIALPCDAVTALLSGPPPSSDLSHSQNTTNMLHLFVKPASHQDSSRREQAAARSSIFAFLRCAVEVTIDVPVSVEVEVSDSDGEVEGEVATKSTQSDANVVSPNSVAARTPDDALAPIKKRIADVDATFLKLKKLIEGDLASASAREGNEAKEGPSESSVPASAPVPARGPLDLSAMLKAGTLPTTSAAKSSLFTVAKAKGKRSPSPPHEDPDLTEIVDADGILVLGASKKDHKAAADDFFAKLKRDIELRMAADEKDGGGGSDQSVVPADDDLATLSPEEAKKELFAVAASQHKPLNAVKAELDAERARRDQTRTMTAMRQAVADSEPTTDVAAVAESDPAVIDELTESLMSELLVAKGNRPNSSHSLFNVRSLGGGAEDDDAPRQHVTLPSALLISPVATATAQSRREGGISLSDNDAFSIREATTRSSGPKMAGIVSLSASKSEETAATAPPLACETNSRKRRAKKTITVMEKQTRTVQKPICLVIETLPTTPNSSPTEKTPHPPTEVQLRFVGGDEGRSEGNKSDAESGSIPLDVVSCTELVLKTRTLKDAVVVAKKKSPTGAGESTSVSLQRLCVRVELGRVPFPPPSSLNSETNALRDASSSRLIAFQDVPLHSTTLPASAGVRGPQQHLLRPEGTSFFQPQQLQPNAPIPLTFSTAIALSTWASPSAVGSGDVGLSETNWCKQYAEKWGCDAPQFIPTASLRVFSIVGLRKGPLGGEVGSAQKKGNAGSGAAVAESGCESEDDGGAGHSSHINMGDAFEAAKHSIVKIRHQPTTDGGRNSQHHFTLEQVSSALSVGQRRLLARLCECDACDIFHGEGHTVPSLTSRCGDLSSALAERDAALSRLFAANDEALAAAGEREALVESRRRRLQSLEHDNALLKSRAEASDGRVAVLSDLVEEQRASIAQKDEVIASYQLSNPLPPPPTRVSVPRQQQQGQRDEFNEESHHYHASVPYQHVAATATARTSSARPLTTPAPQPKQHSVKKAADCFSESFEDEEEEKRATDGYSGDAHRWGTSTTLSQQQASSHTPLQTPFNNGGGGASSLITNIDAASPIPRAHPSFEVDSPPLLPDASAAADVTHHSQPVIVVTQQPQAAGAVSRAQSNNSNTHFGCGGGGGGGGRGCRETSTPSVTEDSQQRQQRHFVGRSTFSNPPVIGTTPIRSPHLYPPPPQHHHDDASDHRLQGLEDRIVNRITAHLRAADGEGPVASRRRSSRSPYRSGSTMSTRGRFNGYYYEN